MMGILEVKNVNKRFGGLQALGDVNLSVAENSVHAVSYTHLTLPTSDLV